MSSSPTLIASLPRAHGRSAEVARLLEGRKVALFLDYDGTLTPIVADPAAATIDDRARATLAELAVLCDVAIISGRDLDDVRRMVGVDGITYAGSHGFDIARPDGTSVQHATEFLPALAAAEEALRSIVRATGARAERKRFALAVHYRGLDPARVPDIERAVHDVSGTGSGLKVTGGKMVVELRPDVDWDKGAALLSLLADLPNDPVPIYLGDDVTDEDAFRVVRSRGLGLVVSGERDERETLAHYVLDGPAEALSFLAELAASLRRR